MSAVVLNLGCGFNKLPDAINLDAYSVCEPDVVWDLNQTPLPFDDNSIDTITAFHVFEHLVEWWPCFVDCARILKPMGLLRMAVPHSSSTSANTYRDHHHEFSALSFCGIIGHHQGTNAWAMTQHEQVPLKMIEHINVPYQEYQWMRRCPWLLRFCSLHLRNFIWEQQFTFQKVIANDK